MTLLFGALVILVGLAAAGIAAIAGFGIGSLLTPVLAIETGTKVAVAAVAIPHVVATAQRFWLLRRHVDRRVLVGFGVASAIGGLAGALVHAWVSSRALTVVFGIVVALAGVSELTGWMRRVRWGRTSAWIAGALSGALGGMVGNQGGIRTAALLGFEVPKESFVATATAIGLFVDAARLPVYLATQWRDLMEVWPLVLVATIGVVVGTLAGTKLLGHIEHSTFRRMIGVLLVALGILMLAACRPDRGATASSVSHYRPQGRTVTITTVPLLVKEQQQVFPFLKEDFAKGGVLEGKEVYAFSPSTVTVVEGDTIHFTFINPEDDVHSFVLPDLAVSLPGQRTVTATYVAKRADVYPFVCAVQAHLPMMSGQLVVLSATGMAGK
ncbi:MAG TPA: TSUP family transporter [Gemmatimonadaceae bacterium]|nr:TSUP family transporter [Gemmatimonadaceae bacterium]